MLIPDSTRIWAGIINFDKIEPSTIPKRSYLSSWGDSRPFRRGPGHPLHKENLCHLRGSSEPSQGPTPVPARLLASFSWGLAVLVKSFRYAGYNMRRNPIVPPSDDFKPSLRPVLYDPSSLQIHEAVPAMVVPATRILSKEDTFLRQQTLLPHCRRTASNTLLGSLPGGTRSTQRAVWSTPRKTSHQHPLELLCVRRAVKTDLHTRYRSPPAPEPLLPGKEPVSESFSPDHIFLPRLCQRLLITVREGIASYAQSGRLSGTLRRLSLLCVRRRSVPDPSDLLTLRHPKIPYPDGLLKSLHPSLLRMTLLKPMMSELMPHLLRGSEEFRLQDIMRAASWEDSIHLCSCHTLPTSSLPRLCLPVPSLEVQLLLQQLLQDLPPSSRC
ncbi:hypothetical protein HOLleu_07562 [Holothuria leucospilota]|uniref:Uncharacterized protein n=1 Tax=Holothuria leucospilota TaxID=206669 RepID=A0A9Q1CG61_HOLLE|nr:hypothetical protein HOLleu_07562 [Holothuria leucospilota]